MNLKDAIAERDFRFSRYLQAQKKVDEIARQQILQCELRVVDRPMKPSEVADVIGVHRSTVTRWDAGCNTTLEWHDYIRENHEKYLADFRKGVGLTGSQLIQQSARDIGLRAVRDENYGKIVSHKHKKSRNGKKRLSKEPQANA